MHIVYKCNPALGGFLHQNIILTTLFVKRIISKKNLFHNSLWNYKFLDLHFGMEISY